MKTFNQQPNFSNESNTYTTSKLLSNKLAKLSDMEIEASLTELLFPVLIQASDGGDLLRGRPVNFINKIFDLHNFLLNFTDTSGRTKLETVCKDMCKLNYRNEVFLRTYDTLRYEPWERKREFQVRYERFRTSLQKSRRFMKSKSNQFQRYLMLKLV